MENKTKQQSGIRGKQMQPAELCFSEKLIFLQQNDNQLLANREGQCLFKQCICIMLFKVLGLVDLKLRILKRTQSHKLVHTHIYPHRYGLRGNLMFKILLCAGIQESKKELERASQSNAKL